MQDFRSFEGKSIDEAIEEACRHFDVDRDKLEIEIISDAKGGIFGLMGNRKAEVRARRRVEMTLDDITGKPQQPKDTKDRKDGRTGKDRKPQKAESPKESRPADAPKDKPAPKAEPKPAPKQESKQEPKPAPKQESRQESKPAAAPDARQGEEKAEGSRKPKPKKAKPKQDQKPKSAAAPKEDTGGSKPAGEVPPKPHTGGQDSKKGGGQEKKAEPKDAPKPKRSPEEEASLIEAVREVVEKLIAPISADATAELAIDDTGRVNVDIKDQGDSGLLIGREGQTLAALQYLANRIVARKLGDSVRIQLDAGDYRERQNESLRSLAQDLAAKAKDNNKPQSTKPLSSYHRRVVHLELQEDEGVITRSKGDGPMKRVLVLPKKRSRSGGGRNRSR